MTIMELLAADGYFSKKVASTGGGEYAGPCPFCRDGKDRFRVWPEQGEGGRWWCRQCGKSGDVIQYLREMRGLSFREACAYIGKVVSPSPHSRMTTRPHWQPRRTTKPGELWQARARRLVEEGEERLFQPQGQGKDLLDWLREKRGLSAETVKVHHLGFHPKDTWDKPEHWSLEPVLKDNGVAKKLWVPRGLIIPYFKGEHLLRMRIRRPRGAGDPRYYLLKGSDTRAMVWSPDRPVILVVESELDGMLLNQEAADLAGVVALGSAQARPDHAVAAVLRQSRLILIALDGDDPGAREAWRWWTKHFPQARRWPPIDGKDPGEMWQAGVDLCTWVMVGIEDHRAVIHGEKS
jgi:DNA primase